MTSMERIVYGIATCIIVGILTFFTTCNGCTVDDDEAKRVIDNHGLREPKLGGAGILQCSRGESSREFTATNVNGRRVEGVVCCGLIAKGCTVRWD